MKKVALLSIFLAAMLVGLVSGCTNVSTFNADCAQPPPLAFAPRAAGEGKSVAVLPFLDQRAIRLQASCDSGSFYWGLLPLAPFGWVNKEFPEASGDFVSLGRFQFSPANDLAAAAAVSLRSSHLFREVESAASPGDTEADYLFEGTLASSHYTGRLITYGITYFLCPALWLVGFPEGISHNELAVSFVLRERSTGKVVWNYSFHDEDYLFHWIYARIGRDTDLYAELMRRALNGAMLDIHQKLEEELQ